jgi:hypothetical protein
MKTTRTTCKCQARRAKEQPQPLLPELQQQQQQPTRVHRVLRATHAHVLLPELQQQQQQPTRVHRVLRATHAHVMAYGPRRRPRGTLQLSRLGRGGGGRALVPPLLQYVLAPVLMRTTCTICKCRARRVPLLPPPPLLESHEKQQQPQEKPVDVPPSRNALDPPRPAASARKTHCRAVDCSACCMPAQNVGQGRVLPSWGARHT